MQTEITPQITTTTLSLELSDIYTYISTLNDQISQLTSKNELLQSQLTELLVNPPNTSTSYTFSYSDIASQFESTHSSLTTLKSQLERELQEMTSKFHESTKETQTLKETLGTQISEIGKRIQRLDVMIQSLLHLPEILQKDEQISDAKEREILSQNVLLLHDLQTAVNEIENVKDENATFRQKIHELIVHNNRLSEAIEIVKKKNEMEKKMMNEKMKMLEEQRKMEEEVKNEKEERMKLLGKCETIMDCMNVLMNQWKRNEHELMNEIEMDENTAEMKDNLENGENAENNEIDEKLNEKNEKCVEMKEKLISDENDENERKSIGSIKSIKSSKSSRSKKSTKSFHSAHSHSLTSIKSSKTAKSHKSVTSKKSQISVKKVSENTAIPSQHSHSHQSKTSKKSKKTVSSHFRRKTRHFTKELSSQKKNDIIEISDDSLKNSAVDEDVIETDLL